MCVYLKRSAGIRWACPPSVPACLKVHARRARPEEAPKRPLRPQVVRGYLRGGERGGSPGPPPKMFLLICKKNVCMHKFSPKGQLRLPGGLEGCPPLQKIYRQSFFFQKNLPRRCNCSRRPPEDASGGGGPPLPKKKTGREAQHSTNNTYIIHSTVAYYVTRSSLLVLIP